MAVKFSEGSTAESGRIWWWMYDRPPDGSNAYLRTLVPDDQWKDMKFDHRQKVWITEIDLSPTAKHIDFFSNHGKMIPYKSIDYATYISSPYTRIMLQ